MGKIMQTKTLTVNGTPGYFQLGDETCLITDPLYEISGDLADVDIKSFKIAAKDGLAWNSVDAEPSASATRSEFRTRNVRPNGVWFTDAWDLTRTPETHPLYGGDDSRLKQTEGQWMNGKMLRPVAFIRLLNNRESIFINPYQANQPSEGFEKVYPFKYGTRRYCAEIRFWDTGHMDFIYWVDGQQILNLVKMEIDDKNKLGDLHCKMGVYLRKRDLGLRNGAPDLWVGVTNFRSHEGVAVFDDIHAPASDLTITADERFDDLAAEVRAVAVSSTRQSAAEKIAKSLDKLAKNIRKDTTT